MNPLLVEFVSETRDLLEQASQGFLAIEKSPNDPDTLNSLFRAMHTIKGSSGIFEIQPLTQLVHAAEDVLDCVREHQLELEPDRVDLFFEVLDRLGEWTDALEANGRLPNEAQRISSELGGRLRDLLPASLEDEPATPLNGPACTDTIGPGVVLPSWVEDVPDDVISAARADGRPVVAITYTPHEQCFFTGDDPFHTVRQVPGVVWREVVPRAPWGPQEDFDPLRCTVVFRLLATTPESDIRDLFRYVEDQIEISTLPPEDGSTPPEAEQETTSTQRQTTAAREIMEAQRRLLSSPVDPASKIGALRSAARVVEAALRSLKREEAATRVPVAMEQSLAQGSPAPLTSLVDEVLGELGGPAAPPPPPLDETAPPPAPQQPAENRPNDESASKRMRVLKVDQHRIDSLMDLVGELVVAKNALPFLAKKAENTFGSRELSRDIKNQHSVINRIAEELQTAVMQVRMVPVSHVFQRFPRLVRDLSKKTGKEIRLILEGEETEADKNVVENLADPLIHLIRNSIDHGIEAPEDRKAAGKKPQGEIRLQATQLDDQVLIEVIDDGRGIDPEKVKQKAYEKGLIDENRLDAISDDEALHLVFSPGFSTAEQVSDLSGRGVGMDVVRTMVEQAGGSVSIDSRLGHGTRVQITLPLSMTVTRVMMVDAGGETFGVPIENILETVRVRTDEIHRIGNKETVVLRDRLIPLCRLRRVLELGTGEARESEEEAVLVVTMDGQDFGIVVDRFQEGVDIILKPLGGIMAGFSMYSGTAILGDGSVLLVLNIREILSCL